MVRRSVRLEADPDFLPGPSGQPMNWGPRKRLGACAQGSSTLAKATRWPGPGPEVVTNRLLSAPLRSGMQLGGPGLHFAGRLRSLRRLAPSAMIVGQGLGTWPRGSRLPLLSQLRDLALFCQGKNMC